MTQFLLFPAQSALPAIAQPSTGRSFLSDAGASLGATEAGDLQSALNQTSAVALDGTPDEGLSFANVLNSQTGETLEAAGVEAAQPNLLAALRSNGLSLEDPLNETALFQFIDDSALVSDAGSSLTGESALAGDESSLQRGEPQAEGDDSASSNIIIAEAAIAEAAPAIFSGGIELQGASPFIVQSLENGDITLSNENNGETVVRADGANNADAGNSADTGNSADVANSADTANSADAVNRNDDVFDGAEFINLVPETVTLLDADTPVNGLPTNGPLNITQAIPEELSSFLPVVTSNNAIHANLANAEPTGLTLPQTALDARGQNGIQQALNQPSLGEQNLAQANSEQAENLTQRLDQNTSRQPISVLNSQALAEAPTNGSGILISQLNPNAANVANAANAANAANPATTANGAEANQGALTPEGEALNSTATTPSEGRLATNSANGLSNIAQIAQLLGQPSGNEAQPASALTTSQPTIQLASQGQTAHAAPQTNGQVPTALFTNETLPALTAQLSRGIVAGRDTFNIQLNPSELGRVDVRLLTNDDGSVHARVLVEQAETLDLFQRDLRALERSLLQSGIKLSQEGIDLSLKDNGANQGGNGAAANGDFAGNEGERGNENTQHVEDESNRALNDRLLVEDIEAHVPGDVVQTLYARFTPGQLNIEV